MSSVDAGAEHPTAEHPTADRRATPRRPIDRLADRLRIYRAPTVLGLSCFGVVFLGWLLLIIGPEKGTTGFDAFAYWSVDPSNPYIVPPGGLGGTFGGNPLACAAAAAILDALAEQRPRAEQIGARLRERLEAMAPAGSEVRGLGPMVAIELPEQTGDETGRITAAAREQGLMLLSCGLYGNVIRILVPFTIGDEELERGLDILGGILAG